MTTGVPTTIWRPQNGESEMTQSNSANVTTLSGLNITTLSGNSLVIGAGSYISKPATVWVENDAV